MPIKTARSLLFVLIALWSISHIGCTDAPAKPTGKFRGPMHFNVADTKLTYHDEHGDVQPLTTGWYENVDDEGNRLRRVPPPSGQE